MWCIAIAVIHLRRLYARTVGLAAMGSGDEEVFEDLKNVLYADSAVSG